MTVIGITGPTGAGKTTVLNVLKELGGCILDADAVYHEILDSDFTLRYLLEERFGPLTREDGTFDRKKLGAVVFHDPAALAELNRIAHGRVVAAISERLGQAQDLGVRIAAIDAIALFESGAAELCRTTVAVTASEEVRVRRIIAREGISEEYARARIAAQKPSEWFEERCGHILRNDGSRKELEERARALFMSIIPKEEL